MNKKLLSLLVCSAVAANAQVFMTADIKTVSSDLGSSSASSTPATKRQPHASSARSWSRVGTIAGAT